MVVWDEGEGGGGVPLFLWRCSSIGETKLILGVQQKHMKESERGYTILTRWNSVKVNDCGDTHATASKKDATEP